MVSVGEDGAHERSQRCVARAGIVAPRVCAHKRLQESAACGGTGDGEDWGVLPISERGESMGGERVQRIGEGGVGGEKRKE